MPGATRIAGEATVRLRMHACRVPRRPENYRDASVIGSAAEQAVSWHFGERPERMVKRVAHCGREGRALAALLRRALVELREMDACLDDAAWLLSPVLLLLGQADATFRAGCPLPVLTSLTRRLVREANRREDPPIAVALAESLGAQLVAEMAELLEWTGPWLGEPVQAICNPGFLGYGHICESDADLLLDGTLVEVKVLGGDKPEIRREYVWQLVCYAALDAVQPEPLGIERAAIWEMRRGFRWEATLDEIAERLSGLSWPSLRARLLDLFQEASRPAFPSAGRTKMPDA